MTSPKVSVVVPTLNAGPGFEKLLHKISTQETDFEYEVVVLDSGSTDGTIELARYFGVAVRQIPSFEFDHGATRNLGISISQGEYVALTVQDAVPLDERWLSSMVEVLEKDERVAGVYGRQLPNPDSDELTRILVSGRPTADLTGREQFAETSARYRALPPAERRRLATFDNVSSCLRRTVWEQIPFRRTNFGEDLRWGVRALEAGYKLVYEPSSAVYHSHGRGVVYDLRRHYVDQLVLLELFGLVLVPNLGSLAMNALRSTAYLYRHLWRSVEARKSLPRLALQATEYAAVSQLGAYLAVEGRRLSQTRPGLYRRMDCFLKTGV